MIPPLMIEPQLLDGAETNLQQLRATSTKVGDNQVFKISLFTMLCGKLRDTVTPPTKYGSSTVQNQRNMTRHS
jgi:hypothetical protein